jgi:hypothetical protein
VNYFDSARSDEWPFPLDRAINAGFDPGGDYGSQPVAAPGTPLPLSVVRWNHQGSVEGCEACGVRCDTCDDRMCEQWGPEPRACGTTCVDCPCDCTTCRHVREDMRADLMHQIAKEEGR